MRYITRPPSSLSEQQLAELIDYQHAESPGQERERILERVRRQYAISICYDDTGALAGFVNTRIFDVEHDGKTYAIVMPGILVKPEYRFTGVADRLFLNAALRCFVRGRFRSIWTLNICLQYRSYRLMANYLRNCFPRVGHVMTHAEQRFFDRVTMTILPPIIPAYQGGPVLLAGDRTQTEACVPLPTELLESSPTARLYAEINPRYIEGSALLCLAEIRARDIARIAMRRRTPSR